MAAVWPRQPPPLPGIKPRRRTRTAHRFRKEVTAARTGTAALVGRTVADVERDLIIETLKHTLGNRTHAANILGISIRTLRNKLKLYTDQGLPVPAPAGESDRGTKACDH